VSIQAHRVPIVTDSSGNDLSTVRAGGCRLIGVQVDMGTIAAMDVAITDEPTGTALLTLTDVEASGVYQPAAQMADPSDGSALSGAFSEPSVFGRIQIAIANGGDTLTGEITLLIER